MGVVFIHFIKITPVLKKITCKWLPWQPHKWKRTIEVFFNQPLIDLICTHCFNNVNKFVTHRETKMKFLTNWPIIQPFTPLVAMVTEIMIESGWSQ